MKCEGLPTEGFCAAAGILSMEKATEIINVLCDTARFDPSLTCHSLLDLGSER